MGSVRVTVCAGVLAALALAPSAYAADARGVSVTPATPAPGSDVTLRVAADCARRTAVAASAAFVADARLTVSGAGHELAGDTRVRSALRPGTYPVRVTCDGAVRDGTVTVRTEHRDGVREGERPAPRAVPGPESDEDLSAPGAIAPDDETPGSEDETETPGSEDETSAAEDDLSAADDETSDAEDGVRAEESPREPGHDGQSGESGQDGQPSVPRSGGQPSVPAADASRPGPYASPVAPVRAGGGGAAAVVAAQEREAGPGTAQGVTGLVLAGAAALAVALRGYRRSRGTG
ncbi:hypothetical protein [Streptomyces sp. bgisy032]|uniref:hypothetical protein n=1 Tax=Streptomyces sp. bgisy032 TaxID=3413773 RepID=UPI003D7080D5